MCKKTPYELWRDWITKNYIMWVPNPSFIREMTQEETAKHLMTVKWKVTIEDTLIIIEPLDRHEYRNGVKMFILKEDEGVLRVLHAQHIVDLHNKSLDNGITSS